ncbi:MAG TPA: hypothetical protein VGK63_06340 [Candidatus Limnocylindrales bacterium]
MSTRLMAPIAIAAALLVAGCAGGTATVTGTLVGADGACLYLDVQNGDGTTRYWLRHLPSGYDEGDERGVFTPGGHLIRMGARLTASGALSWLPFEHPCDGSHTLDATAID